MFISIGKPLIIPLDDYVMVKTVANEGEFIGTLAKYASEPTLKPTARPLADTTICSSRMSHLPLVTPVQFATVLSAVPLVGGSSQKL